MKQATAYRLANLLSVTRLPLAVGYGLTMLLADARAITITRELGNYKVFWLVMGLLCLVLVLVSDWADGYVARKYNAVSTVGKFIDPIFDVIFFLTAFAIISWIGLMWWTAYAAIVARELTQHLAIRPLMMKKGVNVAARMSGKMKTVTQCSVLIVLTIQPLFYHFIGWGFSYGEGFKFWSKVATAILAGISIISLFPYVRALVRAPVKDPSNETGSE